MARPRCVVLLALAMLGIPAQRSSAGNIPSTEVEETTPPQDAENRSFQTVRGQLREKGLSREQATRVVAGLTRDEAREASQNPRQVQWVGALAWYWLSLIATAVGYLMNRLFGK